MPTKKHEVVRLGVIGAGLAARLLHWPALDKMRDRFQVTMVASASHGSAVSFAELVGGCPWTLDYRELLRSSEVDAVLITLPIHLNAQVLVDAVIAGKHVLCEKPIASNMAQAEWAVSQVRASKRDGQAVAIAEHFRYRRDILTAKEWIADGRIGDLILIDVHCYYSVSMEEGFGSTPWRHDSQFRGGLVTDSAVHHAALLREIGGEPEQVQAFTKLMHPRLSGIDTMTLNLRFRNGALGRIFYCASVVGANTPFVNASLYGTGGTILMNDKTMTLCTAEGEVEKFGPYSNADAYVDQLVNFHEAITAGAQVVSTAYEAMRDLELLMKAYDAAESRTVELFTQGHPERA